MNEALIALGGVLVGLVSGHVAEWIRWRRQEAKAKRVRELDLKRELYLPLVAAYTEGISLITKVANAPADSLSALRLSPQSEAAIAAKDLVANDEVLFAAGTAAKELALSVTRMMAIKTQESAIAIDLVHISSRIEQLNRENALINNQFESLSAQGQLSSQFLDVYRKRFDRNQEELDGLFPEQNRKLDQKNALILKMNKQSIEEIMSLSGHAAKAVIAIRKDLDLSANDSAILSHYRSAIEEIGKMMPDFIDKVWADLDLTTKGEQVVADQHPARDESEST